MCVRDDVRYRGELARGQVPSPGQSGLGIEQIYARRNPRHHYHRIDPERAIRGSSGQETAPAARAAPSIERPQHIVPGIEVDMLQVGDRGPDDVASGSPVPVDGAVREPQAIEKIVGRSDEQGIQRQDALRPAGQGTLPDQGSGAERQHDDASVGERHEQASATDGGPHGRRAAQGAAPQLPAVEATQGDDLAGRRGRYQPTGVPERGCGDFGAEIGAPERDPVGSPPADEPAPVGSDDQAVACHRRMIEPLFDGPGHRAGQQLDRYDGVVPQRDVDTGGIVRRAMARAAVENRRPRVIDRQQEGGLETRRLGRGAGRGGDRQQHRDECRRRCGASDAHNAIIAAAGAPAGLSRERVRSPTTGSDIVCS